MHGRVLRAVSLAAVFALLTAGATLAAAGGRGTVTTTQQFRDFPLFPSPRPSRTHAPGNLALLTAIAHTGVFHTTSFTDGHRVLAHDHRRRNGDIHPRPTRTA